jgi:hypothetical protein
MNNFNKQCIDILKSKEIQKEMKEIFKPIIDVILENISIYLFIFIFFILMSFLMHLGILIILVRYLKLNSKIN